MAKAKIDNSLCTGCGICVDACPEVFGLSADGLAEVISDKECASGSVEEVAENCPVNAISIG